MQDRVASSEVISRLLANQVPLDSEVLGGPSSGALDVSRELADAVDREILAALMTAGTCALEDLPRYLNSQVPFESSIARRRLEGEFDEGPGA